MEKQRQQYLRRRRGTQKTSSSILSNPLVIITVILFLFSLVTIYFISNATAATRSGALYLGLELADKDQRVSVVSPPITKKTVESKSKGPEPIVSSSSSTSVSSFSSSSSSTLLTGLQSFRHHGIELDKNPKGGEDFHFVHIPKCGGTSMTAVLRQVVSQQKKLMPFFHISIAIIYPAC